MAYIYKTILRYCPKKIILLKFPFCNPDSSYFATLTVYL